MHNLDTFQIDFFVLRRYHEVLENSKELSRRGKRDGVSFMNTMGKYVSPALFSLVHNDDSFTRVKEFLSSTTFFVFTKVVLDLFSSPFHKKNKGPDVHLKNAYVSRR